MKKMRGIKTINAERTDKLVDDLVFCFYCHESFKECDTVIPGIGVTVGETDIKFYKGKYWHHGCIYDFEKEKQWRLQ